jgi:AcrR family transcriptional regulator
VGKRQETRDRIEAQIVTLGRRHLETEGAAGLSLRAIARELGMVSSAVYRYVASRDELLTLLLVDAYSELADTVDRARAVPTVSSRDRLLGMGAAARRWAVDQPARWALLYGSPVPGYHAPAERTVLPGTRVVQALFDTVAEGVTAGEISVPESVVRQPLSSDFDGLRAEFGFDGPDALVIRCIALWAGLVGAINLEVFGQYGAETFTRPAVLFDAQFGLLVDEMTGQN